MPASGKQVGVWHYMCVGVARDGLVYALYTEKHAHTCISLKINAYI